MDHLTYLNFDLSIENGYLAKGLDFRGRETTGDFQIPFSKSEIEDFWRRIGRSRSQARRFDASCASDSRAGSDPIRQIDESKIYGGSLFEAIFRGDLLRSFSGSLEHAIDEGRGLRIRLRLTAVPELANLPWEYLYDRSCSRFFALSWKTPVVRYLELPSPVRPLTVRPPLKMLVMVASPWGCPPLDVEREWHRLNEELGGLTAKGLIELERLEGATLPGLQRRLRRGGAHIFHFIGHGDFEARSQEGVLILEDDSGAACPATAEQLGVVLHDYAPRLVLLNCCLGARASRHNPFSGVAQALIQQGVPAVVAMQTEVQDDFAQILAHELYGALADGFPVDAALAEARKVLDVRQHGDWGTVVLYLRAPDGRILQVETEGRRAASGTMARLGRTGVAVLVVAVVLLLAYAWRESPTAERRAQPLLSETEAEGPEGSTSDPAAAETEVAPSDKDRVLQETETAVSEPAAARSHSVAGRPDSEALAPAGDAGSRSKPAAHSEARPTRPAASSWPRGNPKGEVHRNQLDGQPYVWIPAGEFLYGCSPADELCVDDEKPPSEQTIERGFWLGQTEVTVRAYRRFREDQSQLPAPPSFNSGWKDETQPIVNLSRAEAVRFCEWAATRLPTEVEWEYAARAGEKRFLPDDLSDRAWFSPESDGRAHPVGQKEPNAFGLYDMLGNVAEWVAPAPDVPAESGVLRGGSWRHERIFLRFSFRLPEGSSERNDMYGFRCLADPY